jgi:pimeloyl-ACP methyl ester carboxylesterase
MGINPPAVIAIWNGNSPADPWARLKELAPEKVLRNGVAVITKDVIPVTVDQLYGDRYLDEIFSRYLPTIAASLKIELTPAKTAMIGSSMGGLSTLYALANHGDKFHTALALSTHWSLGGMPLVEALINALPAHDTHNIYMSRGTKGLDADYEPFQMHADSLMVKKGYRIDQNFVTRVHARTGHNEKSWASYIDEPINFWLSRTSK